MEKPNNPYTKDEMYWKYENLLESFFKYLKLRPEIIKNDRVMTIAFAHIARQIYDMGYKDATELYEPEELSSLESSKAIAN